MQYIKSIIYNINIIYVHIHTYKVAGPGDESFGTGYRKAIEG